MVLSFFKGTKEKKLLAKYHLCELKNMHTKHYTLYENTFKFKDIVNTLDWSPIGGRRKWEWRILQSKAVFSSKMKLQWSELLAAKSRNQLWLT